ncbi:MAG: hybrid sensor histidine kinase/response regulator [Patescibacteria group bacterium]
MEHLRTISQRFKDRIEQVFAEKAEYLSETVNKIALTSSSNINISDKMNIIAKSFEDYSDNSYVSLDYYNSEHKYEMTFQRGKKDVRNVENEEVDIPLKNNIDSAFNIRGMSGNERTYFIIYPQNIDIKNQANKEFYVAEYGYNSLYNMIDEAVYAEKFENNINPTVVLAIDGAVVWSPSIEIAGLYIEGEDGHLSVQYNSKKYDGIITNLPQSNLSIVTLIPLKPLFANSIVVYVVGFLSLVVGVLAYLVTRKYWDKHLTKPVLFLLNATANIAKGKYQINYPYSREDEIGKLASSFEEMASAVRIYQDRLIRNAELVAIGQISSQIAHDMRSPISVIKSYIIAATRSCCVEQEYSNAASRSVDKLNRMADDLLDYAKAKKIMREVVNFKCVCDESVLPEVSGMIKARSINLNVDVSKDLFVSLDGYKMGRVLINMINNSIRALESVGENITVVARGCGNNLIVTIKDDGYGIERDSIKRVFDSFFSTDRKKGTGLGLAYCKQVVEAHGGTIEVESEVGKGTTFTIRIPNCVVSEAEARACRNEPQIKINGRRFILIDDDADIRMRWRRVVEEGGGTVVGEADSPEKACGDGLDISAADVAIVDYSFEGSEKTGLNVIAHLKTRGLEEIHMCTGFAHDETIRQAALAAGADSVVQKTLV